MIYSCTYDPLDNKLRLSASSRLDPETYKRVRDAGFIWAPKQEIFVAPMWTPEREDLALELAGEIDDEDTSLVDRAEERAERFEEYRDNRAADAESARKAVDRIADGIPMGQPILIGHHSERHARKDAEKIENGMRRAIKMWDTAQYWKSRAAGAIRHAKYKELPAVRHRRIKTLEAALRKVERSKSESEMWLHLWKECAAEPDTDLQAKVALRIANMCWLSLPRKEGDKPDFSGQPTAYDALTNGHPTLYAPRTLQEVLDVAMNVYPKSIATLERWIAHYENRLTYEREMLGESGGIAAEQFNIEVGGQVLTRHGEWSTVLRVNRIKGAITSVRTNARYVSLRSIEEVKDYRAADAKTAEAVKTAMKLPPLVNYPSEGSVEMLKADYDRRVRSGMASSKIAEASEKFGRHRYREAMVTGYRLASVYITDIKRVDPPPAPRVEAETNLREIYTAEGVPEERQAELIAEVPVQPIEQTGVQLIPPPIREPRRLPFNQDIQFTKATDSDFEAMRASLRAGVQVVSAPQLFPTPPDLVARMIQEADIRPGDDVLEPSAGTGNILDACFHLNGAGRTVAVEINARLAMKLQERYPRMTVLNADFIKYAATCTDKFDVILMNPPFVNGADIEHIGRALTMLKPSGRLVAICANGPRQQAKLKPLAEHQGFWEDLPPDTFKTQGTGVNVALMYVQMPEN